MKKIVTSFMLLLLLWLAGQNAFSQPLTAIITIDDYQWLNSQGVPINMSTVFPGTSLTSYYAPLPVLFQGWQSAPRETIVDYCWDFGDNSPVFHGFNAGHVYEIPGIYTVMLTVKDTLGNTNTTTVLIEVLERAGTTYYVDAEIGNDNYNGLSSTFSGGNNGPWQTADKAFTEIATSLYQPGDCILFNRGQTFELSVSGIIPGHWPSWGYMFGAYGYGEKPIIQYNGANNTIIIHQYSIGFAHVSFVDLDFRFDDYNGHKAGVFFFAQGGGTRNILFLRVDALDLYSDLFVFGQYMDYELSTGVFVFNSSIRNTYIDPLNNVTLFAIWGSRFVCMNNYFDLAGNHIGYTAIDKGVISGNTFSRPAFGRTALRICGFQGTGQPWNLNLTSNNVQISENCFHGWIDPETVGNAHNGGGTRYNYLLVQLAPNGPWNQIIRDITFERNVITNGEGMLSIGAAENIIVRNNISISNTDDGYHFSIVDANKPCKNIKITGNTIVSRNAQYSGNPYGMKGIVQIQSNETQVTHPFPYTNHQDIQIQNNAFYINGTNDFSRFLYINDINVLLPEITSDNNLFFVSDGSETGQFFQIGDAAPPNPTAQYLTLAQWQNQQGKDIASIYANPQFVDLLGPDGQFSEYGFDADLRLQESSPAREIAFNDLVNSYFDYERNLRFAGDNQADIGAYEYIENISVLNGDANCDGVVNLLDGITTISYIMGQNPLPFCFENADVTQDGIINVLDFIGIIEIIFRNR